MWSQTGAQGVKEKQEAETLYVDPSRIEWPRADGVTIEFLYGKCTHESRRYMVEFPQMTWDEVIDRIQGGCTHDLPTTDFALQLTRVEGRGATLTPRSRPGSRPSQRLLRKTSHWPAREKRGGVKDQAGRHCHKRHRLGTSRPRRAATQLLSSPRQWLVRLQPN